MKALIVVDMQRDFVGGTLAVPHAADVILPIINRVTDHNYASDHRLVIVTRDWHPENHVSFRENPKFVNGSWPLHCVQGTPGAKIIDDIANSVFPHEIVSKGMDEHVEAYSGFDGFIADGRSLVEYLRSMNVDGIEIVGLALDYCVAATAIDGARMGFDSVVYLPGTRAVSPDTGLAAIQEMARYGVRFTA